MIVEETNIYDFLNQIPYGYSMGIKCLFFFLKFLHKFFKLIIFLLSSYVA
jgi:hypothetical protein